MGEVLGPSQPSPARDSRKTRGPFTLRGAWRYLGKMRFPWEKSSFLLALLVGLAACSAETDDPTTADPQATPTGSSSEEAINGGQVERAYPAVGLLRFPTGNFGSGTLIAPNVVLTAAHVALGKPHTFFFGGVDASKTPTSENMQSAPVKEWVVHPCYDKPDGPGCPGKLDVAVVHLATNVTTVTPVRRYTGDIRLFWGLYNPFVGDVCTAVGFGAHLAPTAKNPNAYTAGTRRSARSQVSEVTSTEVVVRWVTGIATSGDSGGPLLCNGQIIGTVRGSADATNVGVERTREGYIRIDRVSDFVDAHVADWK